MTLDTSKPTDTEVLSTHAGYIRETRVEIDEIANSIYISTVALTAGQTVVSTLSTKTIDIVLLTADASEDLITISGDGINVVGHLKFILFNDSNITVKSGSDNIILQGADDLAAQTNDMLGLRYDGTNWQEFTRQLRV